MYAYIQYMHIYIYTIYKYKDIDLLKMSRVMLDNM